MAKACIGYRNRIDEGYVAASSAQPSLPATLLQNPHVALTWRTVAGVTSAYLLADLGAAVPLGGAALIGTNLSTAATVRARVSSADATGAAGDLYDSGTVAAGVDPDYGKLVKFWSQVSGRYLRLDLADSSLPYIAAGRWWAGEVWTLARNYAIGASALLDDTSAGVETDGGQVYVQAGVRRDGARLTLPGLTRAEAVGQVRELWRRAGTRNDILFCRDPASTNLGRDTLWGLIQGRLEPTQLAFDLHSLPLTIIERK